MTPDTQLSKKSAMRTQCLICRPSWEHWLGPAQPMCVPLFIVLVHLEHIKGLFTLNKDFVGLRSCNNAQTERLIFKYANWPRLQIKWTGPSRWSIQLVRPAGRSSRSLQLVHPAGQSSWSVQLVSPASQSSWWVQLVSPAGLSSRPAKLQCCNGAKLQSCKVAKLKCCKVAKWQR